MQLILCNLITLRYVTKSALQDSVKSWINVVFVGFIERLSLSFVDSIDCAEAPLIDFTESGKVSGLPWSRIDS